jgi:serine/threonine protein kinase
MGVVYQARDEVLGRTVALKTIALAAAAKEQERPAFEKRFLQEARAAASLAHPCIVVVYDAGNDPATGLLYMALEYLRGKTLHGIIAQGERLDWREALRATARLADALHHAHGKGIIHRDVKPANIMVLASGEPKLMDFGVAKVESSHLTTGGNVLGSPPYMSPEQADGQKIDGRSDLFSLGSVLYELLTGRKAFGGHDLPTILTRLAHGNPVAPSELAPGLPAEVDAVVARALAKSPSQRYANGRALAEDLEDVLARRPPRTAMPQPRRQTSTTVPSATPVSKEVLEGHRTVRAGSGRGALAFPPGRRVSLAILSGSRQGDVIVLQRPSALIGRAGAGGDADIEVPDPEVSRAHAVVECYGSRMLLRDLDSRNGTFVTEQRIKQQELHDREEFRVGRTRIMVVLSDGIAG